LANQHFLFDHRRLGGGFFSKLGIALAGGDPLGMRLYYLIGLTLGAMLGIAVVSLETLHLASLQKRVGLSVLYVEVMSLPLLAAGTLALKMGAASAALWFSISFVMHLVYGLALGVVTSYGVAWSGTARHDPPEHSPLPNKYNPKCNPQYNLKMMNLSVKTIKL
jgi:hypothetical protein